MQMLGYNKDQALEFFRIILHTRYYNLIFGFCTLCAAVGSAKIVMNKEN